MEKLEIFRYIRDVNCSGKLFKLFVNSYYQNYYIRVLEDGSLLYPTLEEFKELFNIFNGNNVLKFSENIKERTC